MAEAVALSTVEKIGGCLIEPIQRELGYLFCFNNNFQELETRFGNLKATRNDVYAREDEAQRSWKTLGEAAKHWMVDAKGKIEEAENVIVHKAELQKGCFSIKWCPNLKLRFSLGRKAKKLSLLLNDLLERGDKLPQTGVALPPPPIDISDYIKGDASDFESRRKVMEEIIEMLQDKETRLIGICGMGGIGKTTFAKQVLQKVKDFHKHLFDFQVISTVSSNPNYNTIQQEVVEILRGSSLQGIVSEYARADSVRNTFNNKKVVVLLDDVWEEFDLNAKGFPLLSKSDVECCCKIIYTSRKNDLWSDDGTITKQIISLDLLSVEEALNLFRKKVCLDDHDDEFRGKKEIEKEIVEECGRLPLALEVVGGSLFQKGKHEWNDMLFSIRNHYQDIQAIHKINKVLETSYDFLRDSNLKLLFLLCCLFREDQEILMETLYLYAAGLQLFQGIKDLEHVRNRVYTLVDDLIRRSLLINVEVFHYSNQGRKRAVKMHDVVRDVGISIAKKRENGFSFLVSKSSNDLDTDFGQHTKMISILFQNIDPVSPQLCDGMKFRGPKLELQLLQLDMDANFCINMSEDFFQGMDHLKVLVIYGNSILDVVPSKLSSFSYLANLKMLSLKNLNINNLSTIRHLNFLEILNFRFSSMGVLPNEISELTNLRILDLTGCSCFIRNGVLSKLTNLQELYMWGSFKDWRVPIEENLPITTNEDNNVAAELIELNHLNKLRRLEFQVINIEQLPRNVTLLPSSKLLKFKIRIGTGEEIKKNIFEGGERLIWLSNIDEKVFHTIGIIMENKVTDIVLKNCESVITLSSLINSSRQTSINELMDHLKRIEIRECNQMMYLNNWSEVRGLQKIEFNYLESLILKDLCKLECFYKGINKIYFPKLKTFVLSKLEQFILPTNVQLEMPLLEKLIIESIPYLENLCNFGAPSIKELTICDCPNFKYAFSSASSSMMENICHLSRLKVENCSSLKGILSVSIGARENWNKLFEFSNLESLILNSLCELTSFVIDEEEKRQTSLFYDDEVSFPRLVQLWISRLSKINYIVGWNGLQQQGREYDHVTDNKRKLQRHILFPILDYLQINKLSNLIHIYESNHPKLEPGVLLFQKLNFWAITNCAQLRYLFSENIGRVLGKHLETLYIRKCPMMEVVMKKDDDEYDDKTGGGGEGENNSVPNNHFFPLLSWLTLHLLPELKRFCDIAYTWVLPSLHRLEVISCSKLEALSPGYLSSPNLKTLEYNHKPIKVNASEDMNNTLHHLFNMVNDNEVDDSEDGVDNEVDDKKDDGVDDC